MGILDEAIREHLELKRQHGTGDPEIKQLEDEAFGQPQGAGGIEEPPEMSDADAEAPTDYIGSPAAEPEGPATSETEMIEETETAPPESQAEVAPPAPEMQPAAENAESEPATPSPPPVEEEHPAMEHEVISEVGEPDESEAAESPPEEGEAGAKALPAEEQVEREEIAQHPTELYDVDDEIATEEGGEPAGATAAPAEESIEEDDFFDEQSLSDELDRALDSSDTEDRSDEAEVIEDVEVLEEGEEFEEDEPSPEVEAEETPAAGPEEEAEGAPGSEEEEDVLEETPDFLQDTPEHDRLWFEQKPPKDFDFDS